VRYLFVIIVFVHGLIHLLGFVKGFGFKEVKELTLPVSKPAGIVWMLVTLLFLTYGILYLAHSKYSWLLGFIAVILSQILIIFFWSDAKFGTLPNLVILLVSITSYGSFQFHRTVQSETRHLLDQNKTIDYRLIAGDDIDHLPEPVKNWLVHSEVVGKPYIHIGKVIQKGELKMKPGQEKWMQATAIQYTTVDNPAFIWTVHVKANSLLHFKGLDKFENGKGEMLIKLNSLINIVNEQGIKLDEGTIQRYLGEMVWFPSLALSPYITWEQINDTTVKATMTYKGTSGSGIFTFTSDGDFVKFSALRYMGNEIDAKRYEWVLLVDDYSFFEGIKVPSKMTATWRLENNDWTWLKLEITDIAYNENALR